METWTTYHADGTGTTTTDSLYESRDPEGKGLASPHHIQWEPSGPREITWRILHFGRDEEHVLGVLCLGQPKVRPRDEKLMFQMVTNLGSLALVNARNVSRLREQANTDGLTGLLNKRYCLNLLAELLASSGREAQKLALFIFDIDHFKTYNDTNGSCMSRISMFIR